LAAYDEGRDQRVGAEICVWRRTGRH
jgi:hypothetical protein